MERTRLYDIESGATRFRPTVVLSTTGCSKRPKEAMWRAVVHRHVEIKVAVRNVVVEGGQVGELGHVGSSDRLQEELLGAGQ